MEDPTRRAGTASRRSTVCPEDPSMPTKRSHNHHSVTTTGVISAQSTAPISKVAHLSLSLSTANVSYPIARDSWHLRTAPSFPGSRPRRRAKVAAIILATPSPVRGLGWARAARATLRPVLASPTALQPRGADAANIACDPARRW